MNASTFLNIQGLSRRFSARSGVGEVSLAVGRGQFVVLLGPSGCGKSTTLRLIAGLETPDAGSIEIDGRDVTALPPSDRSLSMVFQSYALFPHLDVAENIVFGLKVRGVARAERRRRLDEALAVTGLEGLEDRKPAKLSGGQRQRVALARAIVAGHPLCLMDEPLSNLDAQLRHSVRQDIRALQKRLGMTVIYVTHDQTEAMSMADVVVLMRDGRIEQVASPADIYERPATTFAAGFIGSPPMAMLPADLLGAADLPGAGAAADLVFGIRGEDISLRRPGEGRLAARVLGQEFLGAETFVNLEVAGAARLTARVPGRVDTGQGEHVSLDWPREATHWFERASGRRFALPSSPIDPPRGSPAVVRPAKGY
ncbi:sn-glycerol 3-phosphate transport system ATP-binding protein [Pseudochelatococcus lubricantis]|uniref:Sn-glycerol 3-phosphate transport system ATP-binding protein n=1 Tax=Pseudochelatococcus lubricantis TaxID=1538102 RepID=A0ABX0UZ52_9HYPH|nr:ABC transporter ATP-binding protein [Pseudochelatococcus lubricantis]NIJ57569.1 sn-glycerol 3-phosphate transport system ATP-binding protein [Pseudochelatococcus lubricantis]